MTDRYQPIQWSSHARKSPIEMLNRSHPLNWIRLKTGKNRGQMFRNSAPFTIDDCSTRLVNEFQIIG